MSETLELEAGRELDALVAERVMGYVWRRARHAAVKGLVPPTGYDEILGEDLRGDEARARDFARDVPEYSTDIGAAWEVVEAMESRGWAYAITRGPHAPQHGVKFYRDILCLGRSMFAADQHEGYHAVELTAPLAICRAALQALASPTPEGTP